MTNAKTVMMLTGADSMLGRIVSETAAAFPEYRVHAYAAAELNISDGLAVNDAMTELRPQWVVNCAGYEDIEASENNREEALRANVQGPQILGEIAAICQARVLHVSSAYVFDGCLNKPYDEEELTCPENIYGKTKRLGELALLKVLPEAVIVRPGWVYGPYGVNFANDLLKAVCCQNEVFAVKDQYGSPTSSIGLAHCIYNLMANNTTGLYHYADDGVCSRFEFAEVLFEEARNLGIILKSAGITPIASVFRPTSAKHPAYLALDIAKYRALPKAMIYPWRESLRYYMKDYLEIVDGVIDTKLD